MRKSLRTVLLIVALLSSAVLSMPNRCRAAGIDDNEFASGFINLLGGITFPKGYQASFTNPRIAYGINADYKVLEEIGLGGYMIYNSGSINNGQGINLGVLLYGVETDYFWKNGLSVGLRLGLSTVSFDSRGASVSTNPFSFGPRVSYDYHLPHAPVSVGADLGVMFITNTTDISTGEENSFFVDFNTLFSVKYWFD
jgi:hypothetical protein